MQTDPSRLIYSAKPKENANGETTICAKEVHKILKNFQVVMESLPGQPRKKIKLFGIEIETIVEKEAKDELTNSSQPVVETPIDSSRYLLLPL